MKNKIRLIIAGILLNLSLIAFCSDNTDSLKVPKNAIILSISNRESGIYYSMVDLENNEMIIAYYFFHDFSGGLKLQAVLRTGIIIDIDKQTKVNVSLTKEKEK